ncbi:hypothetical protein [Bacillus sp. V2I10]|nr:hypothetical protein [Bacillus sp. V2I10]MDQ0861017.1 hypothetical protein [Bacillus sp. V2I10]
MNVQFWMYDPQKGNDKVAISAKEQQDMIVTIKKDWLKKYQ